MPYFRDALGYKSGSTEVTVLTTGGVFQYVTIGDSVLQTVTAGTTASDTIPAYGFVTFSPSTAAQAYTLPAPITGTEVTYVNVTGTSNDTITLTAGTANVIDNKYKTIVIPGPVQSITLIGLSTTLWHVKNVSSTSVGVSTSLPTYSS